VPGSPPPADNTPPWPSSATPPSCYPVTRHGHVATLAMSMCGTVISWLVATTS
jgi:hypothetical protein